MDKQHPAPHIVTVTSGLQFPEGPIALPDGDVLLVEIARGSLTRVSPNGDKTIVAQLGGMEPNPQPMLTNTCYSFIDDKNVVHVASVHEYLNTERTFKVVAGSGGVSAGPTEREGSYANNWARTIWSDMLE